MFFREVVRLPEYELQAYRQLPVWKKRIQLTYTIPREMTLDKRYNFNAAKFTNLKIPVLMLLSGDSPMLFRQAIELIDSVLPVSRVVVLPDQQHIVLDTDPELFSGEVINFLLY